MIAGKMLSDNTYTNKSWAAIGRGMFTLKELNEMERKMCLDSKCKFNIGAEDLEDFEAKLYKHYGGKNDHAGSRPPTPIPGAVAEQTTIPLPSSGSVVMASNVQVRDGLTPSTPPTPIFSESSNYAGFNSSPKWAPPSPSARRSTPYPAGPMFDDDKELVWVEYNAADYEDEGKDGENLGICGPNDSYYAGYGDEESEEETDDDFF